MLQLRDMLANPDAYASAAPAKGGGGGGAAAKEAEVVKEAEEEEEEVSHIQDPISALPCLRTFVAHCVSLRLIIGEFSVFRADRWCTWTITDVASALLRSKLALSPHCLYPSLAESWIMEGQ